MKKVFFIKIVLLMNILLIGSDITAKFLEKEPPVKIRAVWRDDPSSTISILWDAGFGYVWDDLVAYDTIDHGEDIEKYKFLVTPEKYTKYKGMNNALLRLKKLTPNTKYYFLIKNSFGLSRRFWFKTAPNSINAKFSYITGGDSRNNRTPRINANLLVSKLRSLFVLFGGDFTDDGSSRQWQTWLSDWQLSISKDGRVTPLIVTRGNHESNNTVLFKLFDMPKTGYYALSFSENLLRIIVLNSEISIGGKQKKWLAQEFFNNQDYVFKTAIYHRPIRPHTSSKKEGKKMYKYWAPLFYKYSLDLAVESDSHTVKSTYPLKPIKRKGDLEGFIRSDIDGTVFVGEGCWGAPLRNPNDSKPWTHSAGSFNQFKLVFIDKENMSLRTIKTQNARHVESVSGNDPFEIPLNLDVWSPPSGSVLNIQKKNKSK